MGREDDLINEYKLEMHPEGGWFSECFTAGEKRDGRALAGSIYYLMRGTEISHFHQIDCDEVWYYHEGCGMRITVITSTSRDEYLLGSNIENDETVMVAIPKGAIFAAENLSDDGYTFVSCMTTPKFTYDGFRLIRESELRAEYPNVPEELYYLAYRDGE